MTATLERRRPGDSAHVGSASPSGDRRRPHVVIYAGVIALLGTASLPLTRVYVGVEFVTPVLSAAAMSVAVAFTARKLRLNVWVALASSAAAWGLFASFAFLRDSMYAGVVPTLDTAASGVALWSRGVELIQVRAAPTFAEAGLLLITTTGVWVVAFAVDSFLWRVRSALAAGSAALVLWVVPLTVAPATKAAWLWAVPFLAAVCGLMLAQAQSELEELRGDRGDERPWTLRTGLAFGVAAIAAGVALAPALPGAGRPALFDLRGAGGTSLTTNPIVDIRARLVARDTGPVLRVTTPRPVYLRTTALDVYSETEEWTNSGIQGKAVNDGIPLEFASAPRDVVRMSISVENLPGAILAPVPYQPIEVDGELGRTFLYDERTATVLLPEGETLSEGDRYSVAAAIPQPTAAELNRVADIRGGEAYTAVPNNVPASVRRLADEIVEREGARTPFQVALAIQDELRTWTYSLDPPAGHSARAMEQFLETRIGYCEQFAGTMAVMLRLLGIPSRVAVGYTPGHLVDQRAGSASGTYVITNGNAHAWPEVLFPGYGWIAFEPTPRDDDNVLVPTATNLAPARTDAQAAASGGAVRSSTTPEEQLPRNVPGEEARGSRRDAPAPEQPLDGTGGGPQRGRPWLYAAVAMLAAMAAVIGARMRNSANPPGLDGRPSSDVLFVRRRIHVLGRRLGTPPRQTETDHEYLERLARPHGDAALGHARKLADVAALATFASSVPESAIPMAERAGDGLAHTVLSNVPAPKRALVRASLALANLPRRRARAASSSAGRVQ